jgi:hypothetical protein
MLDAGILPSWGYGLGVAAGLRLTHVRVMVGGALWLSQGGTEQSPYGADFTRRTGDLSGCYVWPLGQGAHLELGPCVTMTLQNVTSSGTGPELRGGPGNATWVTAGLAARAGWSLTRWASLFLRPSLTFSTSRPTFVIDGVGPIYQVPVGAFGVEAGWEWIL